MWIYAKLEILQEKVTEASKKETKTTKPHRQADVLTKWNEHYATGLRMIKSHCSCFFVCVSFVFRDEITKGTETNAAQCLHPSDFAMLWLVKTSWEVLPEKLCGGVLPASENPYPINDQNLRFSLPYLWPEQNSIPYLWPLWLTHFP